MVTKEEIEEEVRRRILKENWIQENIDINPVVYAEDRWMDQDETQFHLMKEFEKKARFKFVITNKKDFVGQITNQIGDLKEDVILVQKAMKLKDIVDDPIFYIFIGSNYDGRRSRILETITWGVYKYLFITKENKQIILLSPNKLDLGEYMIKGDVYTSKDTKSIGDTNTILVEQMILLPHKDNITPLKVSFNSQQASEFIKKTDVEQLKSHIFNNKRHEGGFEMFENLTLAWLFSGKFEDYPLHIIWVGDSGCGKSVLLEMLCKKIKENQDIIEGEISTIKGVVPSFRSKGGDCGAFQRALRVFMIDEFLRMIERSRNQGGQEGMIVSSTLSMMNSMLEHKRKLATSGNGTIPVDIKSKCFFATNDFKHSSTFNNLLQTLSENAFASRFLWYYTTREHLSWLRKNKVRSDKNIISTISDEKFLALYEFYQENSIEITDEIEENAKKIVETAEIEDSLVKDHYSNSRIIHHFYCILDGCRKLRQIQEGVLEWDITEKDYKLAIEVMNFIIKSWGGVVVKLITLPKSMQNPVCG